MRLDDLLSRLHSGVCAAFLVTAGLAASSPANAHLMLVRQGPESAEVPNASDLLGTKVATGDFNGDGFDDLASSAPNENEGLGPHVHGSVIVNYGSERGIRETGADFLTVGAVGDVLVRYGLALATGNFNNDAYDDLAVGLPDFDGNMGSTESSGEVWIHLGGPTGLQPTPNFVLNQAWGGGGTLEPLDRFGSALAAGDFNLDSFDDLAVGSPGEDNGSGAVNVFTGSAAGISSGTTITLSPIHLGTTPQANGGFGSVLAAGHMFSGPQEDLAIGAPDRDVNGQADAGQVFLVAGSATGLTTIGTFHVDLDELSYFPLADAEFGFSLAVGHLFDDPDSPNQLVIGAPGRPGCTGVNCFSQVGQVFVLHDFSPPFFFGTSAVAIDQNDGPVPVGNEALDRFGHSVAVGDFDEDGFDDLAVGVPNEDHVNIPIAPINVTDAGQVFLWIGGDIDFEPIDASLYHGRVLNDTLETGARLGSSLAFGKFDSTGRANLAIGSPGKDDRDFTSGDVAASAGCVYILAPWRQPQNRPHRSSVALDCNGQIIFAQRPFQPVPPASVTKALTVLLAVEAIQSGEIDSTAICTIPAWIANNVSGSQAGFVTGEQVRFVDLIKLAISVSAGDACYAIGDTLTGGNHTWNGLDNTIPLFNNRMNIRADQLGMVHSNFNNPSGRPLQPHSASALDWARFSQAAMQNELFRYYVGQQQWAIQNYNPTVNSWLQTNQVTFHAPTDGIKPGGNSLAQNTGLWSAEDVGNGRYHVAAFGIGSQTWGAPFSDGQNSTGRDLQVLAQSICNSEMYTNPPLSEPSGGPWGRASNIPTGPPTTPATCPLIPLETGQSGAALIEIYPQELVASPATFSLTVRRSSELLLGPGESTTLLFSPLQAHHGFRIYNILRTPANLFITRSEPSGTQLVTLAQDSTHVVPAHAPITGAYSLTIQNSSTVSSARLQVDELGYQTVGSASGGAPFTATLSRDPRQVEEVMRACVQGQDPAAGNLVQMVVRPPSVTVGVDPTPVAMNRGVLLHPARPNPFHQSTAVTFDLSADGPVWVSIHDLSGRRVRTLSNGGPRTAGRQILIWDGHDDAGNPAPVGVYFQRVRTLNGEASARVIRMK